VSQASLKEVSQWLAQHGLTGTEPTPLLAARLSVRRQARAIDSLLLATFLIGAALTHVLGRLPLVLTALVAALLSGQWLLHGWVLRSDRRAGAQLTRRVAHPVKLGWRAVLGRPYAAFTAATFAGAILLAVSTLTVPDPTLRNGAVVVLIGLAGTGVGLIMQLRQVLTSPAVADNEASLTADVIMRVEDARALVTPSLVWSLPAIFLYGESLGWWNAASVALVVAGVIALALIHHRTTNVETTARRALAVR
jgi:hypothetical protein